MKRVAIITLSDAGYKGQRIDESGPLIQEIVTKAKYHVIWTKLLPDDRKMLSNTLIKICDEGIADLVLTTGGTGFSPTDITPEATADVIERETPGITEGMRYFSLQFTKRAMLSRAKAGIRKSTLIVNLPGSPKAVRECLDFILPELKHGLAILLGEEFNCGEEEEDSVDHVIRQLDLEFNTDKIIETKMDEIMSEIERNLQKDIHGFTS